MSMREIMLVGSVPLKPASKVFDCVCNHGLAPLMKRVPDGEQAGWASGMTRHGNNPAFELAEQLMLTTRQSTFFADHAWPLYRLKKGLSPTDVDPGPLNVAESAIESYREFKRFKAEGKFAKEARFCVTLAGPGTSFGLVDMPHEDLFPLVERAFKTEIATICDAIPHSELSIQLDLAGEVEIEELRRRPQAFDMPAFRKTERNWPFKETVESIARICAAIPNDVELGFHLCAIWHIDQSQGQDLNVHVDWTNALSKTIERPIGYIHMPTTLDYDERDFEPLRRLRLKDGEKLFLGIVHAEDGAKGAARRVKAAALHFADFGVAAFCGLAQPSREEYLKPHSVDEIMEMHLAAARA